VTNPLRTPEDYELFIYTLVDAFPGVRRSTVAFIRRGATSARVTGELIFDQGFRLTVRERLTFQHLPVRIDGYGYELWHNEEKLSWYDSQPHPGDPELAATDPHHKHVPPDIKHHRLPAPHMSFNRPNLPYLIDEIQNLIAQEYPGSEP
jgi:hypothetical protein